VGSGDDVIKRAQGGSDFDLDRPFPGGCDSPAGLRAGAAPAAPLLGIQLPGARPLLERFWGTVRQHEARVKPRTYAYMLHFLLDRTYLEARLVELPGHVLNEVKVDGKWMAFDANVNVFYRQSWKETVGRGGKEIGVVMFPLLAVNPTHKHGYRPLAGSFRQFMLARVAMGFHAPLSYSQTLPKYFR